MGPLHSLFCGSAWKLRSLYLDRPSFLPTNAFPQLTYLTIFLFNFGEVYWTMGDLCNLLSGVWESLAPGATHPSHLAGPNAFVAPHHAPQLKLTRLRAFTFHMFNTDGAVTTSHVLQAFLPLVNLPPSCRRVDLGPVSIDDLEVLTPHILSLDQPLTRMRLTLLYPEIHSAFPSLHYTGSHLALEFSLPAQPSSGLRLLLRYDTVIPPTFRSSPLLAHVEEVWVTTNAHPHAPFGGDALLPPNARSLALTIPDKRLLHETLVYLGGVGAPLDTLFIVMHEENPPVVRAVLDPLVPVASRIRRIALGSIPPEGVYAESRPTEPKRDLTGWRWRSVGEEFRWKGRVEGGEPVDGGAEMENLLRAVPELLKFPDATIRSGWSVF